jgi:hypothetical protein
MVNVIQRLAACEEADFGVPHLRDQHTTKFDAR